MSPGLDGTGRIADDLWLLAHNDVTGRPYIQPRPLGLGLAAGLLAELVLAGAVSVCHDGITVTWQDRRAAGEVLLSRVLAQVAGEPQAHPVGDWLAYLARTAPTDVAARLEQSGYLARGGWWPPWRDGRWQPTDRDSAFAPMLRWREALDTTKPVTVHGALLAGLADASGLGYRLAQYTQGRVVRPLHQVVTLLWPDLQDLIAHAKAAVDSAVLAHRT